MGTVLFKSETTLKTKTLTAYPDSVYRVYLVIKNEKGIVIKKAKIKFTDRSLALKFYREN